MAEMPPITIRLTEDGVMQVAAIIAHLHACNEQMAQQITFLQEVGTKQAERIRALEAALTKAKREAASTNTPPTSDAPMEQATPPSGQPTPPAELLTCGMVCDQLGFAESVAEIAKVMNEWGDVDSTPEERKMVLDRKDLAMKRLSPSKKK
jgi:hypothetical protein